MGERQHPSAVLLLLALMLGAMASCNFQATTVEGRLSPSPPSPQAAPLRRKDCPLDPNMSPNCPPEPPSKW